MSLPEWVLQYKEPKTEIKFINGYYYKYAIDYKYNPTKKRSDKITGTLLGRLSETEGFLKSSKLVLSENGRQMINVDIKTFGVFGLFKSLLGEDELVGILSLFDQNVSEVLLCAALYRFAHQSPIKRMPSYHSHDFCSENWCKKGLTDKNISLALKTVGENRQHLVSWMQSRIVSPEASLSNFLMIDSTHITTVSDNLHVNAIGYNPESNFDKQIRLMYIFASELKQPVYYKLINGNITDLSSMRACVEELKVGPVVFIGDKGFYSKANAKVLKEYKLHFIIPLRRDNALIDYSKLQKSNFKKENKSYFIYQGRIIWYYEYQVGDNTLVTFLDEALRVREEKDYLLRCETHPDEYNEEKFFNKLHCFGSLTLIYYLPIKPTPQELYETYKQRNEIEVLFDAYKNFLEADKTYMQDRYVLEGWLMANFLAMIAYYRLYASLREANKLNKYSPKDIVELSKSIHQTKIGDKWQVSETTAKTKALFQALNIDYLK
jgi:Transposase DDE domain